MSGKRPVRVALVVPSLPSGGGVPSVARFLHRTLSSSDRFRSEMVSVAMASDDPASVRLLDPSTWPRGIRVRRGAWEGISYRHVGARFAELEFQKYRPRPELTGILDRADLVQVVAGIPAWAHVAANTDTPVALQVATTVASERAAGSGGSRSLPARALRRLTTPITGRIGDLALRDMNAVFVENRWMEKELSARMDGDRVHFAPPGVAVERFRPGTGGRDNNEGYLLSVGRFDDPRKDAPTLFRAYAELVKRRPHAPELVLVGLSSPSERAWRLARDLGVANRIRMREEVPADKLPSVYRGASVFLLSSREEGLGIVLLEAMASGLPVVSTDCGGPSTAVVDGATGYLTPVGDSEGLAVATERLLSDSSLRRRFACRARRRAEQKFSLKTAGRRFLKVYDQLLKQDPLVS